jgi:hypothetical protein
MQGDFFHRFRTSVNPARLDVYRQPGDDDLTVIARYLWNVALSEAAYPMLQTLEVGLRNALHNALFHHCGTPAWYNTARSCLHPSEVDCIARAKYELGRAGKPTEPGRVVAELNFGFWCSLFNTKYERPGSRLWPTLLQQTVPNMPRRHRTRHSLSHRFNNIRTFRNRVFHHERIIHTSLIDTHRELKEAIGWISTPLRYSTEVSDRFLGVLALGWQEPRRLLLAHAYPVEYTI